MENDKLLPELEKLVDNAEKEPITAAPPDEAQLLTNAMITASSKTFAYFYDNKDNISKTDLFKVLLEAYTRTFNIPFPQEMKRFMFDDEKATEMMKNLLALEIHMLDIIYNKRCRENLKEWKETYLQENKGENNENS